MQMTIPQRETELRQQSHIAAELKLARWLGFRSWQGAWKAVIKFQTYANPSMQAEFEYGRELAKQRKVIQATDAPFAKPHFYDTDRRSA